MRSAGILMPVFSLPGKYGIGCFSEAAFRFADYLKKAGQSCWQILPLGPTGYGDSPYQSFSTFAGNPYFISLEELIAQGLLTREECEEADFGENESDIDYGKLYQSRLPLLRKAFRNSRHQEDPAFSAFCEENEYWLRDYALFMAIKDAHDGAPMESWEEDIRERREEAVKNWETQCGEEVAFYEYLQYEFFREWTNLRSYVNRIGLSLIGDIPIYVSADSSDFWAHRELFDLDERGRIRMIAGVPPDGFSSDGQVWGNPLYNWPRHRETGYDWWVRRIAKCVQLYDIIRIDHFRGFDEYFAIPAEEKTARNGHWEKGPGIELFDTIRQKMGDIRIIAEDLGYMKESVRKLVKDTGFPGMKVLEFAFDSRDSSGAAEYLPYRYTNNCVVYTGTHDNETLIGWLDSILPEEKQMVRDYVGAVTDNPQETADKLIRTALGSTADLCVIPMQDYLGLDNSARINHPSTFGSNWRWRVTDGQLDEALAQRIGKLTKIYGR